MAEFIFRERVLRYIWGICLVFIICKPCFGNSLFFEDPEAPEEIYKRYMPMGGDFPDTLDASTERVTETFSFQLHPRDFSPLRMAYPPRNQKSTGLYKVPGEPITVELHSSPPNQSKASPYLVIGTHALGISPSGTILGEPVVASHSFELRGDLTYVNTKQASGLVYLESDVVGTDSFEVTISGAVRAPWFKVGRDTPEQWRDIIRHYPAPWAELEGELAILALPSEMIRHIDDPTPIINYYDQVVRDASTLVGLRAHAGDERDRVPDLPFRFVMDVNFYLNMVNAWSFEKGIGLNWIAFGNPFRWIDPEYYYARYTLLHELGHLYEPAYEHTALEPPGASEGFASFLAYAEQAQEGYWFLGARIEVLGLTYLCDDALFGYLPSFFWILTGLLHPVLGKEYDPHIWANNSNTMIVWKKAFMIQLVRYCSHEVIAKLYRQIRYVPEHELPASGNQQARTDFFFENLCAALEKDLTLLFRDWYVPVSEEAYQRVAAKGYKRPDWLYHERYHGL